MIPSRNFWKNIDMPKPLDDSFELKKELIARCKNTDIECHEGEGEHPHLEIFIRAGRDKRPIRIYTQSHVKDFLAIPFEGLTFLGDYLAVCSYDEGIIEAEVETNSQDIFGLFGQDFEELIFRSFQPEPSELSPGESSTETKEYFSCRQGELQISIGPIGYLKALRNSSVGFFGLEDQNKGGTSLKIKGVQIEHHDETVKILERAANSVFLQIDLALGLPVGLKRQARTFKSQSIAAQNRTIFELGFPCYEYDEAPMQLYWYARKADGMPLLQFLAYYQVIEFYFPAYSRMEALEKVRGILKDPLFRADSDAEIGRIFSALQPHGGTGFGREKDQLLCTLLACVDKDDLRDFLSGDSERTDYFSGRKALVSPPLPTNDTAADLRKAVADRIYRIRCRIVHSKGELGEIEEEPILPFSKEADLLYHEIALVRYIARQVLVKGSKALKL